MKTQSPVKHTDEENVVIAMQSPQSVHYNNNNLLFYKIGGSQDEIRGHYSI
jgi:hypothetical protein